MNNDYSERLLYSVIEQLKSEKLMGGRWLPIRKSDITPKPIDKPGQLSVIAQAVAQCTKCSLHKTRTHTVPGDGNPDARIVFVGEAPGKTEDEQGKPFVGRSGKLLTNIIEAMGLKREEVFICNIIKCRPPDNRDPRPEEITACMSYLFGQLSMIQPEIIIALGAHAAKTLLDTNTAIGQLRGKFHTYQPGPGAEPIKLMATYHPSYLLRNYSQENRLRVWEDMRMVLRELNLEMPKKK